MLERAETLARLRSGGPSLSVGVQAAGEAGIDGALALLEQRGVGLAHVDIMDGRFWPRVLGDPATVAALAGARALRDVHLMVDEPLGVIEDYAAAGADLITVHPDATRRPRETLQAIGELRTASGAALVRGVALSPAIPLDVLDPLLGEVDLILVLGVGPGPGRQRLIPTTIERLRAATEIVRASGRDILVGFDGGVTEESIAPVAAAGPDIVVTGSAVFGAPAPDEALDRLMAAVAGGSRSEG